MRFLIGITAMIMVAATPARGRIGETLAELTARYGQGKKNHGKIRLPGHDQYYFEKDGIGVNCVMSEDKCLMEVFHRLGSVITDEDIQGILKTEADGRAWNLVEPGNWKRDDHALTASRQKHHADIFFIESSTATNETPKPSPPPVAPSGGDPSTVGGFIKANRGNLVFVKGENGAGSGFIAKMGNLNYLFTNAHVAAGLKGASFKVLDGSEVQAAAPVVAVDHDVFRLAVPAGGSPLELMDHVDAKAAVGDAIVVLGNAEGAGVVTPITGKILGIGPNLVEVDAPFVPGNSGSPIIHLKTGQVVGVATYAMIRNYDPATNQPVKDPVIRRFGYRLDSVKSWQPVNWSLFAAQAAQMESIAKRTEDLEKLLSDIGENRKITRDVHTNPAIKRPIDSWFADREHQLSPTDRTMSDQNLTGQLKSACLSDLAEVRPSLTYDYFQRELAEQQRYRESIAGALDKLLFVKPAGK